jgi:hypothetical protein
MFFNKGFKFFDSEFEALDVVRSEIGLNDHLEVLRNLLRDSEEIASVDQPTIKGGKRNLQEPE